MNNIISSVAKVLAGAGLGYMVYKQGRNDQYTQDCKAVIEENKKLINILAERSKETVSEDEAQ